MGNNGMGMSGMGMPNFNNNFFYENRIRNLEEQLRHMNQIFLNKILIIIIKKE